MVLNLSIHLQLESYYDLEIPNLFSIIRDLNSATSGKIPKIWSKIPEFLAMLVISPRAGRNAGSAGCGTNSGALALGEITPV